MSVFDTPRPDTAAPRDSARGKIRVLVLDDHDFVRRGLCAMINAEPDMVVCGAGAVTRFDTEALPSLQPDVVLVDVTGTPGRGVMLVQAIKKRATGTRVVALAMYSRSQEVRLLAAAGAADFVFEIDIAERVLAAVRRAVGGNRDAPGRDQPATRRREPGARGRARRPAGAFNPLEREVIAMIGAGVATESIAVRLRVPLRDVHAHIRAIRAKANLATGVALVRYCVEWLKRKKGRG